MRVFRKLSMMFTQQFSSLSLTMSQDQIREFSWLTGGQLTALLLSIVTVKIVSSIGVEGYGSFVLATSVGGMLSMSFFAPLEQGYIRFYFYYGTGINRRKVYFGSLLSVLGIAAIVFLLLATVVIGAGYLFWGWDLAFHTSAAIMILIAVLAVPLNGVMNAMRMRKAVSIIQIVERLLMISALVMITLTWSLDVTGVVLCTSLATGVSLLLRYRIYRTMVDTEPENLHDQDVVEPSALRKEIYGRVLTYCSPFIAWGLISWVQSNGERWIIDSVMTKGDVGRYGLGSSLVNSSVVILISMFSQFVTPVIFSKFSSPSLEDRRKGMDLIRLNTWVAGSLFGVFAVILYLFGEDIIHLLSRKEFTLDGSILFLLTLGLGLYHSAQSMTTVGLAMNSPGIYLPAKVISALLSVVFYYFGCRWWGLFGIVVAMIVVNGGYLALIRGANRRLLQRSPGG